MKAVRIHECGGTEVLKLEDVDRPALKPGQLLVKSASIGVVRLGACGWGPGAGQ